MAFGSLFHDTVDRNSSYTFFEALWYKICGKSVPFMDLYIELTAVKVSVCDFGNADKYQ
jgi:hypothetical protein